MLPVKRPERRQQFGTRVVVTKNGSGSSRSKHVVVVLEFWTYSSLYFKQLERRSNISLFKFIKWTAKIIECYVYGVALE